jgi:hypothetical protein
VARIFKDVAIYMGRYPMKTKGSRFALTYGVEEKTVTHLGTVTYLSFPGNMIVGADFSGFMEFGDPAVGDFMESIVTSRLGSANVPLLVAISGGTDGQRCFFFRSHQLTGNLFEGSVGDVQPVAIKSALVAARLVRGQIGLPEAVRSAPTGNGTGYQLGALAANQKLYASLHVLSVGAGGSIDVRVVSDDNPAFSSKTDRIVFTPFTGRTEEWREVSGAIADDRWRVEWTRTGGTNFNAVVAFGIGPA